LQAQFDGSESAPAKGIDECDDLMRETVGTRANTDAYTFRQVSRQRIVDGMQTIQGGMGIRPGLKVGDESVYVSMSLT